MKLQNSEVRIQYAGVGEFWILASAFLLATFFLPTF
jgi:hypothetical protein